MSTATDLEPDDLLVAADAALYRAKAAGGGGDMSPLCRRREGAAGLEGFDYATEGSAG